MLTAQLVDEFDGYGLGAAASVQVLQQQLLALSQSANWPAVNPGQVTGTVNIQTIIALANVVPQLSGLDAGAKSALDFALKGAVAMGAVSTEIMAQAQKVVEQYATYLTGAIGLLIAKYGKGGTLPPVNQPNPAGINLKKGLKPALLLPTLTTSAITTMTTTGTWRIAVPKAAGLGGGLGAAYQEVAPSTSKPAGAAVVSAYTFDLKTGALPFYKDWRIMVPAGVGLAAVLGLVVWWWRR